MEKLHYYGTKLLKILHHDNGHYEKDEPVAMEYGVREGEEFTHCYVIPLTRDLHKKKHCLLWKHGNMYTMAILILKFQTCMMLTQTMTWILIKL